MKTLLLGVMGMMMAMNCAVSSDDMTIDRLFEEGKTIRFTFLKEIIIGKSVVGVSACMIGGKRIYLDFIFKDDGIVRRISPKRSFTVTGQMIPGGASWIQFYQVEDTKETIVKIGLHVDIKTIGELKDMCKSRFKIDVIDGPIEEAHYQDSKLPSNV